MEHSGSTSANTEYHMHLRLYIYKYMSSLGYFLTVEKQDVRPEAQESCLGPILSLSLEEFSSPGYDIVYDTSQWHVGESRGSARGFRRHSPRLPAYEPRRKTGHAFKDSHQGHCGFGSEIGFRLHGGQSYVLGRCLPDHQGTIISIDCIILLFCIRLETLRTISLNEVCSSGFLEDLGRCFALALDGDAA